jgi:hypothetical protein
MRFSIERKVPKRTAFMRLSIAEKCLLLQRFLTNCKDIFDSASSNLNDAFFHLRKRVGIDRLDEFGTLDTLIPTSIYPHLKLKPAH